MPIYMTKPLEAPNAFIHDNATCISHDSRDAAKDYQSGESGLLVPSYLKEMNGAAKEERRGEGTTGRKKDRCWGMLF